MYVGDTRDEEILEMEVHQILVITERKIRYQCEVKILLKISILYVQHVDNFGSFVNIFIVFG